MRGELVFLLLVLYFLAGMILGALVWASRTYVIEEKYFKNSTTEIKERTVIRGSEEDYSDIAGSLVGIAIVLHIILFIYLCGEEVYTETKSNGWN